MTADTRARIERIYREEYGRVIASLVRRFGDLDIAEDAAGEALLTAVERWPTGGIPPNPGGWLTTTAGNRAIDRIRRESLRDRKHQAAMIIDDPTPHQPTGPVADDRLRLMFTCCHPALAPEARVALTLRLLGGLTVAEIASAFLVAEATVARRITRAKSKIRTAHIPFRIPDRDDVTDRLDGVLTVIYLIFNEGYLAAAGADPIRSDLTAEAIRLGRLMREMLPDDGEVAGLLALMLLTDARRAARIADDTLVTLDQQDRGRWDRALIVEGHTLVRECLSRVEMTGSTPGRYQIMAAINAVHTDARDTRDTDLGQIGALYDQLHAIEPTPIVALNRAVAIAELDGPAVALAIVDGLALDGYHAWHATRADLLRRLGRDADARAAYGAAIAATRNPAERRYLERRRDA
ncbi:MULTISPECIES: RNA polymerase sigma factor [Gordonia]|uniref:Sigma-70 family RNA polymerase sigma factor n=1 Tax=Gordonia tangerina TaxID=2911060 RepID=A0ABS9DRF1_9ACTN|nr:sigma-70 family RNA polymerase sigma factor [Gordonia tangerina]MCF3941167.1 sigma-70 family RNA polymerase sigma factor [Gordonia tangerina]